MKPLTESERLQHFWRETVYQAVRDLKLAHEATEEERDSARDWIFTDDDKPLSFRWACKVAGLNVEEVRAEVK